MKKAMIYSLIMLVLIGVISGSTYAFFSASTNPNNSNNLNSGGSKIEIIYTGGTEITGPINLTADKTGGLNTTVHIRRTAESEPVKAIIYLNIETLTNTLAVDGFVWEIYGVKSGTQVYSRTGTFKNAEENSEIVLVENYQVDTVDTDFTIYIWLDGNKVSNEVLGAEFSGYIGARSENYTGKIANAS